MDVLTKKQRSQNMAKIRSKDTKPELLLRSILHRLGYRFRLHKKDLPGSPDIVLPKWRTVIFVHGCYWHRHKGCPKATTPATNTDFWLKKFSRNMERDKENQNALIKLGWKVIVVWECEIKEKEELEKKLLEYLA